MSILTSLRCTCDLHNVSIRKTTKYEGWDLNKKRYDTFDSIMKKMLLQLLFYRAKKCFSKNVPPSSVLIAPHLMAQIKKASFLFTYDNL